MNGIVNDKATIVEAISQKSDMPFVGKACRSEKSVKLFVENGERSGGVVGRQDTVPDHCHSHFR